MSRRAARQVNDQIWCRVRDRIEAVESKIIDPLDDQVGCLCPAWDRVRSGIRDQVTTRIWDQVWRRVWNQGVEDTDGSNSSA